MGILRPKIQVLDEEHKNQIFAEATEILETQGIFLENNNAIQLFKEQGFSHTKTRWMIPSDIVKTSLKSTPKSIKLYDREGKNPLLLTGDNVHFDPGSAAVTILDESTGQIREPKSSDFIRFTQIVEHLRYIDAQSTSFIYGDVPMMAQDWHRLFICLSYCNKPIITGTFHKNNFKIMRELLLACRKSEKDLAEKPLAIFDACPSPPLRWSDLTTQSLLDAAESMIPSEFISMPLSGASAPITLIGSITQHCAETLAGIVITQLARKGAPVIWGGSPAILDMKHGTTPMGAIETMLINLGDVEMGKFFNLPVQAYMSLGDGKIPDAQAGFEAGIGAVLAALGGINMVSGPGMLNFESTQSIEKLIIDNEIAGMAKHLIRGINDYDPPFASEILKDYNDKEELLSHPTTLKLFKKELFITEIVDRSSKEMWVKKGSKSIRGRAKEKARKLLERLPEHPIDESLQKNLQRITRDNLN
ncbi:MAG: trimethylamine methyltransferase family protein [Candidatus Lokiarchaeota archaeon]|nr:trimethylamine methyltransferase family protein [Candidatus Lokiarchaeota archaeon]